MACAKGNRWTQGLMTEVPTSQRMASSILSDALCVSQRGEGKTGAWLWLVAGAHSAAGKNIRRMRMAEAEVKKGVTEVVLTLNEWEAEVLARVTGNLLGSGRLREATSAIFRALYDAGYKGDPFPWSSQAPIFVWEA